MTLHGQKFQISKTIADSSHRLCQIQKATMEQALRCWICSVSFDTERQYLRHLTMKQHADMEDMQKGAYAMDLEEPVEMEVQNIEPGVQDPPCILHADAPTPLVPGSSEANVDEMKYTSVQSPVSSPLTFSEDPASLLTDDGSEDDGE